MFAPLIVQTVYAAQPAPDDDRAIQTSLGFRLAFDSNIYDTNANAVESWIGTIRPVILLKSSPAQQQYSLLYQGNYGYFFDDSADNYADHILAGLANFELSSRAQVEFAAATEKQHQDRGSDQTDGINPTSEAFPSEPDTFDRDKWGARFRYGADGNRGRLRFGLGGIQRDYTNNRERTRFFDYSALSGSVGLSLYLHERTAIVVDAEITDIHYQSVVAGEPSRDSVDSRYLLGLTWEATAKTAGSIRVGLEQRRFEDASRAATSNASWEANVRWSPRPYSHFDFISSRRNEETFSVGSFTDIRSYKVAWSHEWNRNWQSVMSMARNNIDFVDATREQEFQEFFVGLRYPQGRLLMWEAGYARRSRDSNLNRLVYDGDMFSVGLTIGN